MTGLIIALSVILLLIAIAIINLPAILRVMGLHRHYTIPDFDLSGKRARVEAA